MCQARLDVHAGEEGLRRPPHITHKSCSREVRGLRIRAMSYVIMTRGQEKIICYEGMKNINFKRNDG